MELGSHEVFLSNYLYCPQLGVNLLAINKLDDNGIHANNKAILYQNNGTNKAQALATAFRQGRLYVLNIPRELILYTVDQDIWHTAHGSHKPIGIKSTSKQLPGGELQTNKQTS